MRVDIDELLAKAARAPAVAIPATMAALAAIARRLASHRLGAHLRPAANPD